MFSYPVDNHQEDQDVSKEKQRVLSGDTNNDVLIMKHLSKVSIDSVCRDSAMRDH